MCVFTVFSLMTNVSAISRLLRPWATRATTSSSRSVRSPGGDGRRRAGGFARPRPHRRLHHLAQRVGVQPRLAPVQGADRLDQLLRASRP